MQQKCQSLGQQKSNIHLMIQTVLHYSILQVWDLERCLITAFGQSVSSLNIMHNMVKLILDNFLFIYTWCI